MKKVQSFFREVFPNKCMFLDGECDIYAIGQRRHGKKWRKTKQDGGIGRPLHILHIMPRAYHKSKAYHAGKRIESIRGVGQGTSYPPLRIKSLKIKSKLMA